MKILFILFLFITSYSKAQNTIGLPQVINYTKQSYSAGLQNWDIIQDKSGLIYFANNEGLLSFDGHYWKLFPLPNKTIVRSVQLGTDNKIYAGGQNELGYFSPSANGNLKYHSLVAKIPEKEKSFGDVWDIVVSGNNIFFRTLNKIFKYTNNSFEVFTALSEWVFLGMCNGQILAHDNKNGILFFENNVWKPLNNLNILPVNDPVTELISKSPDSILVATLKNGVYLLTDKQIKKSGFQSQQKFTEQRIYAATLANTDQIAFATTNDGVYITDMEGQIVQHFSKTEGLQNDNVLSIYTDNQGNLWLGLDNGIDCIAYNSAIKHINPNFLDGSGYTAIIKNNYLYTGTTNGLLNVPLQPKSDLSFSMGTFKPVANTSGQTWTISDINNQLILGHHEGAFLVKENTAKLLSSKTGFWKFIPSTNVFPTTHVIAGNYKGLTKFKYENGTFVPDGEIGEFSESSRFITLDQSGNIWVSHPYLGIFRIRKHDNGLYNSKLYTDKNGLPSILNNHIYKIKNEVLVATEKGVYEFNEQKDLFEPSAFYRSVFGEMSIRYLREDNTGNIWFIHEKSLGVVNDPENKKNIIYFPEVTNKMLSGFEFIYPVNEKNIFVSSEKGFFHINLEKYKQNIPELKALIRTVKIIQNKDSILFGGYFQEVNEFQKQESDQINEIAKRWKTIRFEYASPLFGQHVDLEYSYRLAEFDDGWSPWTNKTEKEYTNLPASTYTFEVKVRYQSGIESAPASFKFEILPPWHQTKAAYIVYVLLLIAGVYFLYKHQKKTLLRQQQKHEKDRKKQQYLYELELNKTESEIVALKNENLNAEITYKNSELASSAMHLVQKGEILSKIKDELKKISNSQSQEKATSEIKKVIRMLNEEDEKDKEWERFAQHFDKVHSDFLLLMKEMYPAITPNELKL